MISEEEIQKNLPKFGLKYLHDKNFVFLDMEYYRDPTKRQNPWPHVKIYCIQYCIFSFEDIKAEEKPILTVYTIGDYENEMKMLDDFSPIFQRISLRQENPERLFPFGYQILGDLAILYSKYKVDEDSFSYLSNTRFFDLITLSRSKTGLIDPRRETFAKFLGIHEKEATKGEDVFLLVKKWFTERMQPHEKTEIKSKLGKYVKDEFDENWNLIIKWYQQYVTKEYTKEEKEIVEDQQKASNRRYAINKILNKRKNKRRQKRKNSKNK